METEKQNEVNFNSSESVKIHLHYLDHFFRIEQNEELQSEQRIKFFVTLVTIIIAFLSLYQNNSIKVLAAFLLILFILGLLIYARIIWSDRKIKQHRELWILSYNAIKKIDPSVNCYEEHQKKIDDNKILFPLRIIKGTLTQIMWVVEGILILTFIYTLGSILNLSLTCTILLSITTTGITLFFLYLWSNYVKQGINYQKNNNS